MTVTRGGGDEIALPDAGRPGAGTEAADRELLVVGVDGSAAATAALRWAAGQARRTGARVVAIAASEPMPVPAGPGLAGGAIVPELLDDEDLTAAADRWLTDAIATLPADAGQGVERRVAGGDAANVLLDAAQDAELLVLGNHGRGAVAGALAGSVAQRCAHHAACPLVLVPAPEAPDDLLDR